MSVEKILSNEVFLKKIVPAEDVSSILLYGSCIILLLGLVLLYVETRSLSWSKRGLILTSGLLAYISCFFVLIRPSWLRSREVQSPFRTLLLVDRSRSMALPSAAEKNSRTRIDIAEDAIEKLRQHFSGNIEIINFGSRSTSRHEATPLPDSQPAKTSDWNRASEASSDLYSALYALLQKYDESLSTIVVISDGRVSIGDLIQSHSTLKTTKIHAVLVAEKSPPDLAIRSIQAAGVAIAHRSFPIRIELVCTGGLSCHDIPITIREIYENEGQIVEQILASETTILQNNTATLELPITLERAGSHLLEISAVAPQGDAIEANHRRTITIDVARERVRILHIAGRPTYDVRALRSWLKANTSIDLVSFFILRSPADEVHASPHELSLIEFPVKVLFTEKLPTFDAIILQDFDAKKYQLEPYLPNLTRYIKMGGGLIHIGGPDAFSGGHYAKTPLSQVTPVEILPLDDSQGVDSTSFVPLNTPEGQVSPILRELQTQVGISTPEFSGTSLVGDRLEEATPLWVHPHRKTPSGKPMPVLAIGEFGDGRSIALSVDSTHRFAFSLDAVRSSGHGYDALWRGLIGWLMRDPRYEPLRMNLVHADGVSPCLAEAPASLRIESIATPLPTHVQAKIQKITQAHSSTNSIELNPLISGSIPIQIPIQNLSEGNYIVRATTGKETPHTLKAGAARSITTCELGGNEWADPQPDRSTLETLTRAYQGQTVTLSTINSLPKSSAQSISLDRNISSILPTWIWVMFAIVGNSIHWFIRRKNGIF